MPTGHVIVCGAEGIAIRIVEQLIEAGEAVVVLDKFTAGAAKTLTGADIATARAIICVTGSDVGNLEFALLARGLRSDIPIVTELSNHAVGHAIAAGNGPGAVLPGEAHRSNGPSPPRNRFGRTGSPRRAVQPRGRVPDCDVGVRPQPGSGGGGGTAGRRDDLRSRCRPGRQRKV